MAGSVDEGIRARLADAAPEVAELVLMAVAWETTRLATSAPRYKDHYRQLIEQAVKNVDNPNDQTS